MPTPDEQFLQRLRLTFKAEAEEHLQAISDRLLELERTPVSEHPADSIESIYRDAHSLKGAARAVDYLEIEAICQSLESIFSAWKRKQFAPEASAFDQLHRALDGIRAQLDPERAGQSHDRQQHVELMQGLNRLLAAAPSAKPGSAARQASTFVPAPPAPVEIFAASDRQAAPAAVVLPAESEATPVADTIRISVAKLDAGLREAEDMLVVKAAVAQRAGELREVAARFEEWRKEWAKVSPDLRSLRHGHDRQENNSAARQNSAAASVLQFLDWNGDYVHALEHKLVALASHAEQDRRSIVRHVDDLLEQSKKLLMLPFSTLAGMFPKLVRDLCRDQGKEADLEIHGADIEVDKRILEQMKDALIHTLRNCVDHGIEKPEERLRLNKPPRGAITVAASLVEGNKVEILVRDDGAGVDLGGVKQSAVRHNVMSAADAATLSDENALSLIFQSEVSTSPIVTTLSGRGLGMAIVRSKTDALGGKVTIESARNRGTTLRMLLPLTLATSRGILVKAADRIFVLPTLNVDRIVRIKTGGIQTIENRETITHNGQPVSLVRLDRVLELSSKPRLSGDDTLAVVVLRAGDQQIAFVVDEVLHEQEVLVKPLHKPLLRLRNVAGATILGSGKVAPILNVADLIESARKQSAPVVEVASQGANRKRTQTRQILVVEDSITSRMLLKGILETAGYGVTTAVDGMEAFATLREHSFDLVVSDVQMPRLDGFELTTRIRAERRLANLPVILVTALESRDQRERGIDAGANAYIIKSTFDQSNLLEAVRRLI